jgi:hypothetical protein
MPFASRSESRRDQQLSPEHNPGNPEPVWNQIAVTQALQLCKGIRIIDMIESFELWL